MNFIKPTKIYFIKLGTSGIWDNECLEKDQTIKVGFTEIGHDKCINSDWNFIRNYYKSINTPATWVSIYTNQLKTFYTSDKNTLWITFYKGKLWWAFASEEVYWDGKSRYRKVIGKWSSTNINGKELYMEELSGQVLRVQNFRSTICEVSASNYLVKKINDEELPDVKKVNDDLKNLEKNLGNLIKKLNPDDFETLVDLVFRGLGCQRVGIIGKQQKTKDIELLAPISNERYAVQVKCAATKKVFDDYVERFEGLSGYAKCYFVVHSPDADLSKLQMDDDSKIVLWRLSEISKFSINAGLIEWIINKS